MMHNTKYATFYNTDTHKTDIEMLIICSLGYELKFMVVIAAIW